MSLISRLVGRLRDRLEMPEQRAAMRSSDPWLFVEIGGDERRARDWSASGVSLDGFRGEVAIGDILMGRLRWHKREPGRPFAAEVMRIEPGGLLALRWLDLPEPILAEMDARQA